MNHHEYASLFPMMSDAEIQTLAADIKENGQHDPIITLDGEILDGRNRYRACEIAEKEPWLQAYQGGDALGWVVSHNLHRRHLTESQRGMIASRLATMRAGAPKGNRNASKTTSPIGEVVPITTKTREDAAAALNVGSSTLDRARRVQRDGALELSAAVESGEVKLGTAETLLSLPKDEQRAVVEQGADKVRERAAELRNGSTPRILPPAAKKNGRLPAYIPTDAPEIWQQARITLDRILPNDKHRVSILNEVIEYCENRINTKS